MRLATARGLLATTDQFGRYHITCAITPHEGRGSNFVLKLDDRTLPSGYRGSTQSLQVQRATRGKMLEFSFGASIHRVIGLDLADAVFEPGSIEIRELWLPRLELLIDELRAAPAVLRLSYLADLEDPDARRRALEGAAPADRRSLGCDGGRSRLRAGHRARRVLAARRADGRARAAQGEWRMKSRNSMSTLADAGTARGRARERERRCAAIAGAAARRSRRAASAGRDQAHAVGARSESVRHASRRPARGARGRGREAHDGQADEPRAADPLRGGRRGDPR